MVCAAAVCSSARGLLGPPRRRHDGAVVAQCGEAAARRTRAHAASTTHVAREAPSCRTRPMPPHAQRSVRWLRQQIFE